MRATPDSRLQRGRRRTITPGRLLCFGVLATVLVCLPLLLPPFALLLLCYALVLSIACLGLNLLLGHTGLLSLGQAAYFGVGAYAGGFLSLFADMQALEMALLVGVLAAMALAALIGLLCVRATKIHFTMLTLAGAQMVHALFVSGLIFRLAGGVGKGLFLLGGGGLYLPRFTIVGMAFPPDVFMTALYYVILGAFGVSAWVMWHLVHSPFGYALHAIRDNDLRAACIGIRVRRYRWSAFLLSGGFMGLAGGLFGQVSRQVTPEQLHWVWSAQLLLATVLGGMGHFWGPVVGACAWVALDEIAMRLGLYRGLVFGGLLIAVAFVCPGGLAGSAVLVRHARRSRRKALP